MSIIFDPADRGASQNAAQGNVAQGGAAQNGAAQEIPASVRNAMELNPNAAQNAAAQSAGAQGGEQTPSAPTWRYEVNTPEEFQKFVQLSSQGAVIFALYAPHSPSSLQMLEGVQKLVDSAAGTMICAAVDVTKLPEAAQAFGVSGVPAGVAVLAGRPAPIYTGPVSAEDLGDVLSQVLQLAAQYQLPGGFDPVVPEDEKPLPPLHAEAVAALDGGDLEGARAAYPKAISENPGDKEAKLGLEQVELLARVKDLDMATERAAAAADPMNIDAAFNVADLDLVGGHVEDAYNRLLRLFSAVGPDDKARVRERLVQLFDVVGASDPRTVKARAALTMALF